MGKKMVSLRLDEDTLTAVRERVGSRGLTTLVESLIDAWLNPVEADLPRLDPRLRLEDQVVPDHVHIWTKLIDSYGIVSKVCECGEET
jgi:hypothetical protein